MAARAAAARAIQLKAPVIPGAMACNSPSSRAEASVSLELDITSFGRLAAALRAVPYLSLLVDSAATILPVGSLLDSDPVEWR
jgi:hypothetical protein